MSTIYFHLRTRNNGIPQSKGGYTVAVKARPNNLFSVCICQCNSNQRYDEKLGEKVAEQRMSKGMFFVQDMAQLTATLNTLHEKLCTGAVPRLNLDALTGEQQHA